MPGATPGATFGTATSGETEPGAVYIYDLVTRTNVYVHRHWLDEFGVAHGDAGGTGPDLSTIHVDDLETIAASRRSWPGAADGEQRKFEHRVLGSDDNWHWMLSRETPFARNKSGEVSQILGIAHDITGRKQAEEKREMFVSLASNSKEFIGMADLEFNRFYVKALHHALERAQLQTGYSLLNYLKKFKICRLKIDQSFVRDITTDIEDKTIVAAVISMARSLGIKTLAEGVETAEQLAFLREQGCDEAQGFYFSKPVPPGAIETLFARDEAYRATVPAGTA